MRCHNSLKNKDLYTYNVHIQRYSIAIYNDIVFLTDLYYSY